MVKLSTDFQRGILDTKREGPHVNKRQRNCVPKLKVKEITLVFVNRGYMASIELKVLNKSYGRQSFEERSRP